MAKDPLHGITLEKILTELVEKYGWEVLGQEVRINCFLNEPSINSSLKFLRRTPWARTKVEDMYVAHLRRTQPAAKPRGFAPRQKPS